MMPILDIIFKNLGDHIKIIASIFTIIVAIISILNYVESNNNLPVLDNLTSDKLSPQNAGETITWTAKGVDAEKDEIQYKFFLNGNAVTEWSSQNSWKWTDTRDSVGKNYIEANIRDGKHANADSYDGQKVAYFIILEVNQGPSINSMTSNLPSPQEEGSTIIWSTLASDSDDDAIQYKFFLDGKPKNDWSTNPTWTWTTSTADIGAHVIEAKIKDDKHKSSGDDSEVNDFTIVAAQKESNSMEKLTSDNDMDEPTIELTTTDYLRINEYGDDSLIPSCAPGSTQATCPSPVSCVDCDGICWSPGSYSNGKIICSQGKWTITDNNFVEVSGYPRTNEYEDNSLRPSCTPGSAQATCPSPVSCVDCNGKCWSPGSYTGGKIICSQGKWTISQ